MVLINIVNSPPRLRGDLTKWLVEINTGVYVGNVNAKVRDELWKRVCDSIDNGQATMVYSTNNEQGFEFKIHNTSWKVVDYEGIKLIKVPNKSDTVSLHPGFSKMYQYQKIRNVRNKVNDYVIIDIETTGLDKFTDDIIEIAALKISNNKVEEFSRLIKINKKIPAKITELTGISDELLKKEGEECKTVMIDFFEFISNNIVLGYNVKFDIEFINELANKIGVDFTIQKSKDVMKLAKRKIDDVSDYKLKTVANFLNIETTNMHRALNDCKIIFDLFVELNRI